MPMSSETQQRTHITDTLSREAPQAVNLLAEAICEQYSDAAIMLYGSGNSVMSDKDPADILYDFYVIVSSYKNAYDNPLLTFANWLIPPNVFYIERETELGLLRAKYAILSIDHFERLVSRKTFHSYFWARFAQPSLIVKSSSSLQKRIEGCVQQAVDTFIHNSADLTSEKGKLREIWRAGLSRSYKAELRAEQPGRVDALLDSYGDWPDKVTNPAMISQERNKAGADLAWRIRAIQGALLSIARLLKGTFTFQGGVDYIAWKISRHAGFELPVKDWERRFPLIGAPALGARYYKLKRQHNARNAEN